MYSVIKFYVKEGKAVYEESFFCCMGLYKAA